jgi:hypothetical protein
VGATANRLARPDGLELGAASKGSCGATSGPLPSPVRHAVPDVSVKMMPERARSER